MKINFGLSLKLTLMALILSVIIIASLTYINIQEQSSFFEEAYSEKATALSQSLDASIRSRSDLEDKQSLQNYILNFILLNKEDVLKVSINLPEDDGNLKVAVSSDSDSVGNPSSPDNYVSYEEDNIVSIPIHTEGSHMLTVITPLHLSGQRVGTYEILLSMDSAYASLDRRMENLVMISALFLLFLVLSFLYLLRKTIVKPIIAFKNAAKKIGEGNLDTKIEIKSRDELGELANAFNHMTADLKRSRTEIENYSKTLEKQVENRTKELDEKVIKLEKTKAASFNIMQDLQKTIVTLKEAEKEIQDTNQELTKTNQDLNNTREQLALLNRNLETKVKERTVEVKKLLQQKNDFINQLGHDLKTPLTPLCSLIPMIQEEVNNNPELKELIDIIASSTDRMKNLVEKTLQLARLNSSTVNFDFVDTNLLSEVNEVIKGVQPLFEKSNIEINNTVNEKIIVRMDKIRFEELFENLITNAVKYTQDAGGTITIDAKEEKDSIIISVKDNGIGLTGKQVNHIFDEFYKVDSARHDLTSHGLGLSICKRIIEKHDGHIWVESQGLGKGSTFYFTLKNSGKK